MLVGPCVACVAAMATLALLPTSDALAARLERGGGGGSGPIYMPTQPPK